MKKNEYRNEFEVAFCRSKFLMIILGLIVVNLLMIKPRISMLILHS